MMAENCVGIAADKIRRTQMMGDLAMAKENFPVFGYVRVSTDNQLENYSIEEQTERIKAYCAAKGWTLLHT